MVEYRFEKPTVMVRFHLSPQKRNQTLICAPFLVLKTSINCNKKCVNIRNLKVYPYLRFGRC